MLKSASFNTIALMKNSLGNGINMVSIISEHSKYGIEYHNSRIKREWYIFRYQERSFFCTWNSYFREIRLFIENQLKKVAFNSISLRNNTRCIYLNTWCSVISKKLPLSTQNQMICYLTIGVDWKFSHFWTCSVDIINQIRLKLQGQLYR